MSTQVRFSTVTSDWIDIDDLDITEQEFNEMNSSDLVELCENHMLENLSYRYDVKTVDF